MKDLTKGKGGKFAKTAKDLKEKSDLKKENKKLSYTAKMNQYRAQEAEMRDKMHTSTRGSVDYESYKRSMESNQRAQEMERIIHNRNEREQKLKESKQKVIGKKDKQLKKRGSK